MKKRLFIPIAIVLVALLLLNIAIHFAAKKTQRQHLLATIDHLPPSTECLFLGNSLIEAGCDATAFQSVWSKTNVPAVAINLGLGATTPVEHYLILKHALSRNPHIKYVVYGFFDDQLNASIRGEWEDLIGNRVFSYYFPKDAATLYAPHSRLTEWRMEIIGNVPMLAERSSLWDKVELFRRQIDQIGMPPQKVNRFGRVADFNALEAADVPSFKHRCDAIVQAHQGFSAPIQAIIDLAQQHGVKVLFVEMPMSPRHRETFYSLPVWTEMRAYLQSLAEKEHAIYIAASDWVPDGANFEDTVHLNEQGARAFTTELASVMSRMALDSPSSVAPSSSKKHNAAPLAQNQ